MAYLKRNDLAWLHRIGAGIGVAVLFGAVLFLLVPAALDTSEKPDGFNAVDPVGWTPTVSFELCPPDSMPHVIGSEAPSLFLRYDASAPETLPLVVNRVMKDGSERRDTMLIPLRDVYGRPFGSRGYVMSEMLTPLKSDIKDVDCRLVELHPADTVPGVHCFGIVLNDNARQRQEK